MKNVKNMNMPTTSSPRAASRFRVTAPPSMMPEAAYAITVIASKKATMAPVLTVDSSRSFKLAPQRLQKLRPGVMVVPQVEQNINSPSPRIS